MVLFGGGPHSQLFTLRVWAEEIENGNVEWRGRVQHSLSGEQLYFHDWATLVAFVSKDWPGSGTQRGQTDVLPNQSAAPTHLDGYK